MCYSIELRDTYAKDYGFYHLLKLLGHMQLKWQKA